MSEYLEDLFNRIWYAKHPLMWPLLPVSWLFCLLVILRRQAYRWGLRRQRRCQVPVIVVGNITAGGTGKTPMVVWLSRFLKERGVKPGIITRGYGGQASQWPQQVRADSDPVTVGDEAVLLARRTNCPVAAGARRCDSIESLLKHTDCNLVISDDGLQHLSMERDMEILVVDGIRRFGNERCLPAGPLRERKSRLDEVDMIVSRGLAARGEFSMQYQLLPARKLLDESQQQALEAFAGIQVHAVTGIGHPANFYSQLRKLNIKVVEHTFADHHLFQASDFSFDDGNPIIMTEKDAVKCFPFATENFWYVPIEAVMPEAFETRFLLTLKKVLNG